MKILSSGVCLLLTLLLTLPAIAESRLVFTTIEGSPDTLTGEAVLKEAYKRVGIDIKILRLSAKEALRRSNAGEADGEVTRIDGASRRYPNLVQIPIPISYIQGAVFSKNPDLNLVGWHSLRPYRIGRVKGILFAERGTRGMKTKAAPDYDGLVELMLADQVDLMIVPYINGLISIRKHPRGRELQLNGILETYLLYHYLHKSHEDLVPVITEILKAMLLDGTIPDMRRKVVRELTGTAAR